MTGYNAEVSQPNEDAPQPVITPRVLSPMELSQINIVDDPATLFGKGIVANYVETAKYYEARLREARADITNMDDDRLNTLWEKACDIATEKGYCDVFDTILGEIGTSWRREREYTHTVRIEFVVNVTTTGRNAEDARENVDVDDVLSAMHGADWDDWTIEDTDES